MAQNNQVNIPVNIDPAAGIAAAQAVTQAWQQAIAMVDQYAQRVSGLGGGNPAAGAAQSGTAYSSVAAAGAQNMGTPGVSAPPPYIPPMPPSAGWSPQMRGGNEVYGPPTAAQAQSQQRGVYNVGRAAQAQWKQQRGNQTRASKLFMQGGNYYAGIENNPNELFEAEQLESEHRAYNTAASRNYRRYRRIRNLEEAGQTISPDADDVTLLAGEDIVRATSKLRRQIEKQVRDERTSPGQSSVSDSAIRDWMGGGKKGPDFSDVLDDPGDYEFGSKSWRIAMGRRLTAPPYLKSLARAGLYGAADAAEHYFQTATQETITGVGNPLGMGAAYGALPGAILGGAVGGLFGPLAGAMGAAVGARAGGAAANFFQAGGIRDAGLELANTPFAFATGQNPSNTLDTFSQKRYAFYGVSDPRTNFGMSDMDNAFARRDTGSDASQAATYLSRALGLYSGNDRASAQDEQKVADYYQRRAAERGEVWSDEKANAAARSYLLDSAHPGQKGIALLSDLDKYGEAADKYGSNTVDILQAVGFRAAAAGMRENGIGVDPQQLAKTGMLLRGYAQDERYNQFAMQGATADLSNATMGGHLATGADWDAVTNAKRDFIDTMSKEIKEASKYGGNDEIIRAKEAAIKQVAAEIASTGQQMVNYNYGLGMANASVDASRTNLVQTQAGLWGGAGAFSSTVLPMQQKDISSRIAVETAKMNASQVGSPDYLSAQANINNLMAQSMGLPAAAQGADIARGDLFGATDRTNANFATAQAGLYGGVGNIGQAGQGQIEVNARERSRLQAQLANPQSEGIRQTLLQRLAQLDTADMGIRAGVSSAQYGRENAARSLAAGEAGLGIEQSSAYGTDADVSFAYGSSRSTRSETERVLRARLADQNLPLSDQMQIRGQLQGMQSEAMREQIGEREIGLGRGSSRYGERRGNASFALEQAETLGSAGQYRNALSDDLGSIRGRRSEIAGELSRGNLTFDQRHRLTMEDQSLRREGFAEEQRGVDEGYRRDDLEGYDLDHMRLSGARRRAGMLPFGGGNRMGLDLQALRQDQSRMGQLQGRYQELSRGGNLSPQRRMALEREYDSLQTDQTEIVASLSQGMENYLPGLSTGRPSRFSMFDSYDLAAMHLGANNSIIGRYGARNGAQLAMQRAPFAGLGGPGISGPNTGNQMTLDSPQVVNLLQQVVNLLARGNGSNINPRMRPGEAQGSVQSVLNNLVSPGPAYKGTGAH